MAPLDCPRCLAHTCLFAFGPSALITPGLKVVSVRVGSSHAHGPSNAASAFERVGQAADGLSGSQPDRTAFRATDRRGSARQCASRSSRHRHRHIDIPSLMGCVSVAAAGDASVRCEFLSWCRLTLRVPRSAIAPPRNWRREHRLVKLRRCIKETA